MVAATDIRKIAPGRRAPRACTLVTACTYCMARIRYGYGIMLYGTDAPCLRVPRAQRARRTRTDHRAHTVEESAEADIACVRLLLRPALQRLRCGVSSANLIGWTDASRDPSQQHGFLMPASVDGIHIVETYLSKPALFPRSIQCKRLKAYPCAICLPRHVMRAWGELHELYASL